MVSAEAVVGFVQKKKEKEKGEKITYLAIVSTPHPLESSHLLFGSGQNDPVAFGPTQPQTKASGLSNLEDVSVQFKLLLLLLPR